MPGAGLQLGGKVKYGKNGNTVFASHFSEYNLFIPTRGSALEDYN